MNKILLGFLLFSTCSFSNEWQTKKIKKTKIQYVKSDKKENYETEAIICIKNKKDLFISFEKENIIKYYTHCKRYPLVDLFISFDVENSNKKSLLGITEKRHYYQIQGEINNGMVKMIESDEYTCDGFDELRQFIGYNKTITKRELISKILNRDNKKICLYGHTYKKGVFCYYTFTIE